ARTRAARGDATRAREDPSVGARRGRGAARRSGGALLDDRGGALDRAGGVSMDLHVFWFVMLGVLLAGYAILDGFDLGVGILHPFLKSDHDRRVALNSIGPIWDGNEVWLVTFGGALFAAFPN